MSTTTQFTQDEVTKIKECPLHGYPFMNPGCLWYSPNSSGYSTYSPPCNGCKIGEKEHMDGLWMTGFQK